MTRLSILHQDDVACPRVTGPDGGGKAMEVAAAGQSLGIDVLEIDFRFAPSVSACIATLMSVHRITRASVHAMRSTFTLIWQPPSSVLQETVLCSVWSTSSFLFAGSLLCKPSRGCLMQESYPGPCLLFQAMLQAHRKHVHDCW